MKKRNEWVRKPLKRDKKKKDRGIVDFMMVQKHFFKDLHKWMEEMEDPRNVSYITYSQSDFINMGILKNICSLESMRQMEEAFNEETCIGTLRVLSGNKGLEEMPHYDTLNNYLERLSPQCLSGLRKKMVSHLIRGKQFCRGRLLGKYWRVILDGTGLFCFKERHCENCLCTSRKEEGGKKVRHYYHKVLEAKLVLGEKVVISLGSEFIENEREGVETVRCQWITNIEVTEKNLEEMMWAGRGRWKIENEGFNNQKNGIYRIEHLNSRNSRNSNAMKNHYLLTQIADILMQLYLAWCPLIKEINQSIKSTSSRLLESFRRQTVTAEDVLYIERHTCVYLE